jgi:hypothetical protein
MTQVMCMMRITSIQVEEIVTPRKLSSTLSGWITYNLSKIQAD